MNSMKLIEIKCIIFFYLKYLFNQFFYLNFLAQFQISNWMKFRNSKFKSSKFELITKIRIIVHQINQIKLENIVFSLLMSYLIFKSIALNLTKIRIFFLAEKKFKYKPNLFIWKKDLWNLVYVLLTPILIFKKV
jgi:hypothetical protein